MKAEAVRYSFGPVPSRRLGRSLGINNIPPKTCTYSCVYCQAGRTTAMPVERHRFYEPGEIFQDVRTRLAEALSAAERVDYLAFVPDGEPTLDLNLGREIALLKDLGVPVGVITNSSLLWRPEVRSELGRADWVSLKVDSVREEAWRRINRPLASLRLTRILEGILAFAEKFTGELVTETMLVAGINDDEGTVEETADYLLRLRPRRAYLSVPTRPPCVRGTRAPLPEALNRAFQILAEKVGRVECLTGYEGNEFAFTGNAEKDILSITAVHPMREEAVRELLARAGEPPEALERMLERGDLAAAVHRGHTYYLRNFEPDRDPAKTESS